MSNEELIKQVLSLEPQQSLYYKDWGKKDNAVRQMLFRIMQDKPHLKFRCFSGTKLIFREV